MTDLATVSSPTTNAIPKRSLEELARDINERIRDIDHGARTSLGRAIELGGLLKEAKEKAGHGKWEAWLTEKCKGMSPSTARRYMKYYDRRTDIEQRMKSVNLTDLGLSEAQELLKEPRRKAEQSKSDAYDHAETNLIKRLQALSPESAEAAIAETVNKLRAALDMMKKIAKNATTKQ